MKLEQDQVADFTRKAGYETPSTPVQINCKIRRLRISLITEELIELCTALNVDLDVCDGQSVICCFSETEINHAEAYDAILDLLYVVIGTAVSLGLNIDPGFQEVHRSNMTKFIDGHRREDGKWIKGPSYSPAKLQAIIDRMKSV